MKKFLLLIVVLLIVAGIYVYQTPAYRAWFERQSDEILPDTVTHNKVYRWKDPPAKGIDYEEVEYHKDTNVIPAEKLTGKPK